jgi:hypothetical protein
MKLVDDWKAIALKAWSMRWMYGATLLGGVGVVLQLFEDVVVQRTGRVLFALLSLVAILLGIVSRVIEQRNLRDGP